MSRVVLFLYIIFSLTIVTYNNSMEREEIVSKEWKYASGYHIGDILHFQGSYFKVTENLEIYKDGKKVAKILKVNKYEMILKSLDGKEVKGEYVFFRDSR